MNRGGTLAKYLALLGGITVAMSASNPASAQPPCPLGFDYAPGYGCELPNPFYGLPTMGMTHHRWCRSTTTAAAGTVARTVTAVTTGVVTLAMAIPVANSAALGADRPAH